MTSPTQEENKANNDLLFHKKYGWVLYLSCIALLIYIAKRNYDFFLLANTLDRVGVWVMYIGMIVWGLAYIFGPDKKYSDLTTLSFMAFDMLGIILSTMHIFKIANISNLIFFTAMNIIAGIIYVSLPSLVLAKQPKQST